ncbi:hypothetical protein [Chitinophaga sp. CF418]|uniref:hypothetical protein n=1 Tax=Chitinophaga sp. CF418 TaxID=1855287 RepID=UPI00122CDEA5|nr:hypothetical protein [Chitinophaga sp. CF418]
MSHPLLSIGAVRNGSSKTVQRFADETNAARRTAAEEVSDEEMQLDHSISQDTIKKFDKVLKTLVSLPANLKPAAFKTCMDLLGEIYAGQGITVEGVNALLNLRNNLTPSYRETVGDPGNNFAPQVEVRGAIVSLSQQSVHLERIDRAMRSLIRLQPIMFQLPNVEEEQAAIPLREITSDLTVICESLEFLKGGESTIPAFNPATWYSYGEKMVKKVPAEYLPGTDRKVGTIGYNKELRSVPVSGVEIQTQLPLSSYKISKGKNGKSNLAIDHQTMTINVVVPGKTWKHIYHRHTLKGFAGDVKAVNTFWKEDPREVFFEYFDNVLAELMLIIDRQKDLKSEFDKLEEDGIFEEPINKTGTNFFFQGTYVGTAGYNLEINLDSFAPESPEFAYAILPEDLPVNEPEAEGNAPQGNAL